MQEAQAERHLGPLAARYFLVPEPLVPLSLVLVPLQERQPVELPAQLVVGALEQLLLEHEPDRIKTLILNKEIYFSLGNTPIIME